MVIAVISVYVVLQARVACVRLVFCCSLTVTPAPSVSHLPCVLSSAFKWLLAGQRLNKKRFCNDMLTLF